MITELLLSFFFALVRLVVGLIPTSGPPAWLSDASGALSSVWASASGLGAWVPWGTVGTVVAAILSCILLGFTIKAVRVVASFLTGGGGSAA